MKKRRGVVMGRVADFDVPAVARIDHNCADPVGGQG